MARYKQQKFTLDLPDGYTKRERDAIATEVIDFIINRTQQGHKDKNNKSFKPYSKEYKSSLDFKIGKGGSTKVNLTMTEEMLNEIKVIKNAAGKVDIGFDGRRSKLNGKVEGNILGTYGQKKSTGKARDFLGITKKDKSNFTKDDIKIINLWLKEHGWKSRDGIDGVRVELYARHGGKEIKDFLIEMVR